MAISPLTVYSGNAPQLGQSQAVFDTNTSNILVYLKDFGTDLNARIGEINTDIGGIASAVASASDSASTATTQAGIATTKADEASASAVTASNAQVATEALLDAFDDRYLGSFATPPTLDNDGNALAMGALYYDNNLNKMFVYDTNLVQWVDMSYVPTLLTSLSDTVLTTPTDTQVLTYNTATAKWINADAPAGGIGSFIDTSIAISSDGTALANDDGTANSNIGIGLNALNVLTTGVQNNAIGLNAGFDITTGSLNDLIGREAGTHISTGQKNVAVGAYCLFGNATSKLTGSFNIGVGHKTGYTLTTGSNNTLVGTQAGFRTTTGIKNVGIGYYACLNATTGTSNIGVGDDALSGYYSGTPQFTGSYNTGIGYQTGYNLTTGQYNVLNGYQAGYSLTSCGYNTFIGFEAGYFKRNGSNNNVAIGYQALKGGGLNTASFNVAVGLGAGANVSTSDHNTLIGPNAGRYTGHLTGLYDQINGIAIGRDAYLSSAGEMSLGNSTYITSAYTAVAFATRSDERQKDFYDMDLGLDFVTSITPRKYKWKEDAEASDKDSYFYGFSAQEVKANLPTDDKYGMHRTQGDSEDGVQNLTYTELIAPLYKAIQEQQEMIKSLQAEINTLKGI